MSAEWETGIGSSGPGAGMCMRDVTVRTPLTTCTPSKALCSILKALVKGKTPVSRRITDRQERNREGAPH